MLIANRLRMIQSVLFLCFFASAHSFAVASDCDTVKIVVHNALLITVDDSRDPAFYGYMSVGHDGKIVAIEEGAVPLDLKADEFIDVDGAFVAPGFISSHSHLWTSGFRGLGFDQSLYGWGADLVKYAYEGTADDFYWFTLHGSLDFLRNGITTAYDFTYSGAKGGQVVGLDGKDPGQILQPGPYLPNQFRAKIDANIRFVHSFGLPRTGGEAAIRERVRTFIAWTESFEDEPLFLKNAISGGVQRAPTKATAYLEASLMKEYNLDNQPHFLETAERREEQQQKFDWYVEAGALGPSLYFGHFIQTTPEIIKTAAEAGSNMVWQATSNGRLASGIADILAFKEHGMKIGMGLDDQACTDLADPFQNMRIGTYTLRAKYSDPDAMSVHDILRHHTLEGAEVMRIDDKVGSLEPGKFADFLIVDHSNPDSGRIYNPIAHYVMAMGLRNIKKVYVGGKLVADDGEIVHLDHSLVSEELHRRTNRIYEEVTGEELKAASFNSQGVMPVVEVALAECKCH